MSLVQAILISQPIQVATGRFSKECQICQGVVPVCHAIQVVTWTAQVEQSQNLAIEKAWSLNSFTGVLVPLQELENGLLGVRTWQLKKKSQPEDLAVEETWSLNSFTEKWADTLAHLCSSLSCLSCLAHGQLCSWVSCQWLRQYCFETSQTWLKVKKSQKTQNLAVEEAWSLNSSGFTGVLVPLQELENGLLGVWSPGSLRQKRILKQSQYIISFPFINQLADLLYRPKSTSVPSDSYSDGTLVDFGWTGVRHSKFSQHSSQEETCIGPMSCRYLFKLHKKCTGLVSNCIHSVLGLVGQTRYTRILDCNSFF